MTLAQLAPSSEPGGSQGPEWVAVLLRDPVIGVALLALGVAALALFAYVYYSKGASWELQWEVVTNVAIVQAMALGAQLSKTFLDVPVTMDFGLAVLAGLAVFLVGRVGTSRWAGERGVITAWVILGALWGAQALELGLRYDGRVAFLYGVLAMVAAAGAFYALQAGERPFREVTAG